MALDVTNLPRSPTIQTESITAPHYIPSKDHHTNLNQPFLTFTVAVRSHNITHNQNDAQKVTRVYYPIFDPPKITYLKPILIPPKPHSLLQDHHSHLIDKALVVEIEQYYDKAMYATLDAEAK